MSWPNWNQKHHFEGSSPLCRPLSGGGGGQGPFCGGPLVRRLVEFRPPPPPPISMIEIKNSSLHSEILLIKMTWKTAECCVFKPYNFPRGPFRKGTVLFARPLAMASAFLFQVTKVCLSLSISPTLYNGPKNNLKHSTSNYCFGLGVTRNIFP